MSTATTSAPQQQVDMPALDLRRFLGSVVRSEGVTTATDLLVSQRGAGANMSVDVATGSALIKDDHAGGGGYYHGAWTSVENVTIGAAHATLPRIDRVVLRVRDAALGDAANAIDLFVVTGTATSGATLANLTGAGAVPGSSLLLANVLVGAAVSSITTANIGNVAAVLLTASPQILRGVVNQDASINRGSGFTVAHTGTGVYTVTFTQAFPTAPVVVATVESGAGRIATVDTLSTTSMLVRTSDDTGTAGDYRFHFHAAPTS